MTTASQTPGEPAELEALVALAQREHRAGRLAEAAAAYRKILRCGPTSPRCYNNLGNVLSIRASSTKPRPSTSERSRLRTRAYSERTTAWVRFQQALALRPDYAKRTTTWATCCGSRASSTRRWHRLRAKRMARSTAGLRRTRITIARI